MVALWNFDDGTAIDQTENGNDGFLQVNTHTIEDNFLASSMIMGDVNNDEAVGIYDILSIVNLIFN